MTHAIGLLCLALVSLQVHNMVDIPDTTPSPYVLLLVSFLLSRYLFLFVESSLHLIASIDRSIGLIETHWLSKFGSKRGDFAPELELLACVFRWEWKVLEKSS